MYEMEGPHPDPQLPAHRSPGTTDHEPTTNTPGPNAKHQSPGPSRTRSHPRNGPPYLVVRAVLLPPRTTAQEASGTHLKIL